ncbi:UPF0324 membrane protein [Phycisphaerae bacterium]|nr:UPF0324 membrane protein [Phycisphaerae bacterium]
MPPRLQQTLFLLAAALCAAPWPNAYTGAIALAVGIVFALLSLTCWPNQTKSLSRWLLQACIVALGLRLDISQLAHAAIDGLALAIATIFGALALGLLLGKLLGVGRDLSLLISSGTAICGGSAIASVGSAIRAKSSDMAMATAVVFTLNAVGVFTLPSLGHALHLSDHAFGTWAGVAIHDMASVSAVAKGYHAVNAPDALTSTALDQANVVKLTRVLWIIPITLAAAWWAARRDRQQTDATAKPKMQWPWFIGLFILASLLRTLIPALAQFSSEIKLVTSCGFQLALFLIGAAVSKAALKGMGWRALAQAIILWLILASATALVLR